MTDSNALQGKITFWIPVIFPDMTDIFSGLVESELILKKREMYPSQESSRYRKFEQVIGFQQNVYSVMGYGSILPYIAEDKN
jgi:hypothetical protein